MDPQRSAQQLRQLQRELEEATKVAETWAQQEIRYRAEVDQLRINRRNHEAPAAPTGPAEAERAATFAIHALQDAEREARDIKDSTRYAWAKARALEKQLQKARSEFETLRGAPRADEADPSYSGGHSP